MKSKYRSAFPDAFGTKWRCLKIGVFGVYLLNTSGDSDGAWGLYVIDHGEFFGRGRFGAALKCGTKMAGSKIQRVITRF